MSKYHVLMGKRVAVGEYDSDHLLRLILQISKRCNKFALKHTKSVDVDDGGVWVARGFVNVGVKKSHEMGRSHTSTDGRWELAAMDNDPLVAAEKFLTILSDHEEKAGTYRQKLDDVATRSDEASYDHTK